MRKGKTVYIVDDDPSARGGLSRYLRTAGYEVLSFASVEEFCSGFDPEKTGCIVLDIRMMSFSNEDLKEKIAVSKIKQSLILVSADDEPEVRRKAHELGAKGFFRKPVDGTALLDAIKWAFADVNNEAPEQGKNG
jgi:FixJ family two-component response regulator